MSKRGSYEYSSLDDIYGYHPFISSGEPHRKFYRQADIDCDAIKLTEHWPGFPEDPSQPVYNVNSENVFPPVKPVYVSRRRRRGGGYANLYNYNTIP